MGACVCMPCCRMGRSTCGSSSAPGRRHSCPLRLPLRPPHQMAASHGGCLHVIHAGCRPVDPLQAEFSGPGMQEGHEAGVRGVCRVCGLAHADVVVLVQHHKLAIPGKEQGRGRGGWRGVGGWVGGEEAHESIESSSPSRPTQHCRQPSPPPPHVPARSLARSPPGGGRS